MTSTIGRRLVSIPVLFLAAVLGPGLAPVWLLLALGVDLVRPRRFALVRTVAFLLVFVVYEVLGVLASAALWPGYRLGAARSAATHYALQRWWASGLARALLRLFSMRIVVEGPAPEAGPALVFCRHVSSPDTVLPLLALVYPAGWRPRYVLKRELTWDPCLDIVGHRLPNVFVDRDAGDGAREVTRVGQLAEDLGPEDCVVLYPEGTRFTEARRARVIEALGPRDPDRAAFARTLRHTLPPRPGGALALVASAPGADVWFVAHTGFEGTRRLPDLLSGATVGATVRVRLWREPGDGIPVDEGERRAWLDGWWRRLDAWIGEDTARPS